MNIIFYFCRCFYFNPLLNLKILVMNEKKILAMKENLVVQVFSVSEAKSPVFERILYPDYISYIDFSSLIRSLRVLYGEKCLIVFKSQMV